MSKRRVATGRSDTGDGEWALAAWCVTACSEDAKQHEYPLVASFSSAVTAHPLGGGWSSGLPNLRGADGAGISQAQELNGVETKLIIRTSPWRLYPADVSIA